jgi:hypothetical protein
MIRDATGDGARKRLAGVIACLDRADWCAGGVAGAALADIALHHAAVGMDVDGALRDITCARRRISCGRIAADGEGHLILTQRDRHAVDRDREHLVRPTLRYSLHWILVLIGKPDPEIGLI